MTLERAKYYLFHIKPFYIHICNPIAHTHTHTHTHTHINFIFNSDSTLDAGIHQSCSSTLEYSFVFALFHILLFTVDQHNPESSNKHSWKLQPNSKVSVSTTLDNIKGEHTVMAGLSVRKTKDLFFWSTCLMV